ncbi:aldo/keto reductase [Hyphobacterium sp.]|uniref:aldo/keto reductase n=1 Tax=Hyphobacterium sp. TaxID=2004662 RepID=UPI0037480D1C
MTPVSPAMSRLGFGVSGPHSYFSVGRKKTIRLIRQAIDLGINVFDTAPLYGHGEAEKRLGSAIKGLDRSQLNILTKAGVPRRNRRDFSPAGIEAEFHDSLKRLGTDYVDILFLQGVATGELTDELMSVLQRIFDQGKAVEIGVSGRPPDLYPPLEHDLFGAVMAPVYKGMPDEHLALLADQYAKNRLVVGIEAMSVAHRPLSFPRSGAQAFYLARRLLRQTGPGGLHSAEEAMSWALKAPACSTTLCLTTRSEHLRANAALAGL